MSDEYKLVVGRVQFAPQTAQATGKTVRRVAVKTVGPQQALVTVTLWPEHDAAEVNQGDFLFAEGKFSSRVAPKKDGSGDATFFDLSASDIAVIPAAGKAQRTVVNSSGADDSVPF